MRIVVPDASVLLKWVLPAERETYVEQAFALRDTFVAGRCRLLLPSLWIYEVGNVLALKRPRLAVEALNLLVAFDFEFAEPDEACRNKAFELTEHFGVSFYDAAYHAVAVVNHGVFVTADDKYLRRVDPAAHAISLKDWR